MEGWTYKAIVKSISKNIDHDKNIRDIFRKVLK
jgi:hypothetical protein